MIADSFVLQSMIEGKGKSKELLEKMKMINDMGKDLILATPLCALQRAIYLTKPETDMKNLQKLISFLKIVQSPEEVNFTDEKAVTEMILKVAKIFSKLIDEHNRGDLK